MNLRETIRGEDWDSWIGGGGAESDATLKSREAIRWLLYLYLVLWIFEGALRKWLIPSMANPLLIIRDPVVVLIYVIAFVGGLWPRTMFLPLLLVLAGLFGIGGFLAETSKLTVMMYGLRSNFMHLPLIFLIPRSLNAVDVRRIGRWSILLAAPMVILMTLQFKGGPDAWVNAGAGKGAAQLDSAMGRVRASGTWSFVVGPVCFYSFITAYILYGQTTKKAVGFLLSLLGAGSLILAGTVSGSRSLIAGAAAAFGFFIVGIMLNPASMLKAGRIVALGAIAWIGISAMDIFKEGQEVMLARIENAKSAGSLATRVLTFFEFGLSETTMFGKGLGKGTNVGAALLGQRGDFLLAEDEWKRITQESGYIIGPLFIFYRVALFGFVLFQALKAARKGNMLPICLLGACGINLLTGQFGVPTLQGFTCFTTGMVLAACDPLVGAEVNHRELKRLAAGSAAKLLNAPAPSAETSGPKPRFPVPHGHKPVRPASKTVENASTTPSVSRPVVGRQVKRIGDPYPYIIRPSRRPQQSSDTTPPRT